MIFDIFRRKLQVFRQGPGGYVNGLWVYGNLESFLIKASIQGVDNEILETLPEGYRTRKSYMLYTDTELRTAIMEQAIPDIVEICDKEYQVIRVSVNQNIAGYATAHYQVIVVESNVDAN